MPRVHPAVVVCGGSAVLFAALVGALAREARPGPRLVVYAAASLRPTMDAVADDYRARTGHRVELHFGASEDILTQVKLTAASHPADLFMPADDSYVRKAEAAGLTADVVPLARMRAVVLTAKGNPKGIAAWADLTAPGVRVALAEPDAAAIGLLTREYLRSVGRWTELNNRIAVKTGNVTESANAAKLGTVDAAVVWDAVAASSAYHDQQVVRLPELDGVVARVSAAVLRHSADPEAAAAFARYLAAEDGGRPHFRRAGFVVEGAAP